MPYAIWFFLAIEGVPLAAEEAKDPAKNVPRGIIAAMAVLLVTGAVVLLLTTGPVARTMQSSGNPLVEALGDGAAAKVVNYIGLAGLIASFFSIIYAYSRQLFALSRAGYLPKAAVGHQLAQGAGAGADRSRRHRLRAVADRAGRDAAEHGRLRRGAAAMC